MGSLQSDHIKVELDKHLVLHPYHIPSSDEISAIVERLGVRHITFVDLTGAHPGVYLNKTSKFGSVPIETYNDLHKDVTTLFSVLRDPSLRKAFRFLTNKDAGIMSCIHSHVYSDVESGHILPMPVRVLTSKHYFKEALSEIKTTKKGRLRLAQAVLFYNECLIHHPHLSGRLQSKMMQLMNKVPDSIKFVKHEPFRSIYFRWMFTQNEYLPVQYCIRTYNHNRCLLYLDLHDPFSQQYYVEGLLDTFRSPQLVGSKILPAYKHSKVILRTPKEIQHDDFVTIAKFPNSFIQINKELAVSKIKKTLW